jgi:uncharacterized protein YbaA (DUF1428 family)
MKYVDGFLLVVPTENLDAYRNMSAQAGEVWREYGALDYKECVGDDMQPQFGVPFPDVVNLKDGETVVFSFIVYESREHRDRVNAKVMEDPRIKEHCGQDMPFDVKRMTYGGFRVLVDL